MAEFFLESGPEIAGVLDGKDLECLINKIYYEHHSKGKRYLPQRTAEKIEELAKKKLFTAWVKEDLQRWWKLRSEPVHLDLAEATESQLQEFQARVKAMIDSFRKLKTKIKF